MILGHHGIVGADPFDEPAVPGRAGIGDNDAVERAFLGAASGKTNANGHGLWVPFSARILRVSFYLEGGNIPCGGVMPGMAPMRAPFLPILPIFFIIELIC